MADQLEILRKEIDGIDTTLLEILQKRFIVVKKIGKIKKEKELSVVDTKRWDTVMANCIKKAYSLGLPEDLVKEIYTIIHRYAVSIEEGENL